LGAPPRIVVTAAVIERDGRYLVTRRLGGGEIGDRTVEIVLSGSLHRVS
jgi:hypothetical protein